MTAAPRHRLKLRQLAIDTYHENVAYLHRDCPIYRAEGFQALSRVEVKCGKARILAVLNVVDDETIVAPTELGLSEQAFHFLGAKRGAAVEVDHAELPASMEAVRRKIIGERLSYDDFRAITRDVAEGRYSKMEMAAFLVSSSRAGLDRDEVFHLTRGMVETGERLNWEEPLVADKHCIGGIPGNRTSMLVVPIVAAHGTLIPKTSSRSITSPAGTADTMEVLAEVDLPHKQLHRIVHLQRGCLAWGGTARLAPVDDMLIAVERPLELDSKGQMVASILSKKVAAGSTHLLIDIPVGPSAKVRHMREALYLRKLFEFVGDQIGVHLEVIITDGRQPVGRRIGPVLEAMDVMEVLRNDADAPQDLRQKSLKLAGRIIEFDPDVRGGQGYAIARDILDSGRALAKMEAIVEAQGRQKRKFEPGKLRFDVRAPEAGVVTAIDNHLIARAARLAGAPMDKGAGVELYRKIGDPVEKGEPLYRVYSQFEPDMRFAKASCRKHTGYTIGTGEEAEMPTAFEW